MHRLSEHKGMWEQKEVPNLVRNGDNSESFAEVRSDLKFEGRVGRQRIHENKGKWVKI